MESLQGSLRLWWTLWLLSRIQSLAYVSFVSLTSTTTLFSLLRLNQSQGVVNALKRKHPNGCFQWFHVQLMHLLYTHQKNQIMFDFTWAGDNVCVLFKLSTLKRGIWECKDIGTHVHDHVSLRYRLPQRILALRENGLLWDVRPRGWVFRAASRTGHWEESWMSSFPMCCWLYRLDLLV